MNYKELDDFFRKVKERDINLNRHLSEIIQKDKPYFVTFQTKHNDEWQTTEN